MFDFIKRHKIFTFVLILLIAFAAATYFGINRFMQTEANFIEVKKGSIVESIYGIGTIRAEHSFQLKVGIPSVLERVYVKEGQNVNKGQILVKLESNRTYTAPFSGVVTQLIAQVGETVFPQSPILTLSDPSEKYAEVSLEQKGALRAKEGQTAVLSFESIRDQRFTGTVTSVYSNPQGFFLRIDAPNLSESILEGMTADVSIAVKTHENVLLVPVNTIEIGNVYVKRSDFKIEKVPINTGIVDGSMAQIVSGDVKEGDLVKVLEAK